MDRLTAKETALVQKPDFLQKAKGKVNGQDTYICPVCGNGSGKDGDGIVENKRSNKPHWKCFKCGLNEDVVGLWKIANNLDNDAEAFQQVYNYYGITLDKEDLEDYVVTIDYKKETKGEPKENQADYTDFFTEANKHITETDYHRGISLETLNRFKVGYVAEWRHPKVSVNVPVSPRLIIPTGNGSYIARDTRERVPEEAKKYEKQKVGEAHLFNVEALRTAQKPVFVVEGELDALSLIDNGAEAVALGSTAKKDAFIEYVKANRPEQTLILLLDYDTAGASAQGEIKNALDAENIRCYAPTEFYRSEKYRNDYYKDANEMLQNDKYLLRERIEKAEAVAKDAKTLEEMNREEYQKGANASFLQDFINGIHENANTPCIPTGYSLLDLCLDGGLYEGLYIIGAISSLGKTTFVLQMADQIAKQGQDVLIFSLEMARSELIAKSISRHTIMDVLANGGSRSDAKTTRGITSGNRYYNYSDKEKALINKAISDYAEYADRIYITEGIGDIGVNQVREAVEKHISITGNKPVVVIDYLQILAPVDIKASDKQNMDKTVLELKRLSRDKKLPVIAISSFNRDSYKEEASMSAFKESGAIEYGSDVLIGLQLDTTGLKKNEIDYNALKAKDPREIELVILKNRNGKTGNKISFEYYPLFNFFK